MCMKYLEHLYQAWTTCDHQEYIMAWQMLDKSPVIGITQKKVCEFKKILTFLYYFKMWSK